MPPTVPGKALFRSSPFKRKPDRKPSAGRRFQYFWLRYQRVFYGIILAAVLGYGIYWLTQDKPLPGGATENGMAQQADSTRSDGASGSGVDTPNLPDFDTLMSTGTKAQLLASLVETETVQSGTASVLSYLHFTRRAKVAQRAMEMELDEDEKIFATSAYIVSHSSSDRVNTISNLGIAESRTEAIKIANEYVDDPTPAIASIANLALTYGPAYDYLADKNPEDLKRFSQEFEKRQDKILQDPAVTGLFLDFCLYLRQNVTESTPNDAFDQILKICEEDATPENSKMTGLFRQKLWFAGLDLPTLLDRLNFNDPSADGDIQKMFEGLAMFPDVDLRAHKMAILCIRSYLKQEKNSVAKEYLRQLGEIALTIQDQEHREEVLRQIEMIEIPEEDEPKRP